MRTPRSTTGLRRHTRRAATMLEFAFVLPLFMFMLMFTLDMGHVVLMQGAMQDASFSAARVGAQVGGAGINTATTNGSQVWNNGTVCAVGQGCSTSSTFANLMATAKQIPGYQEDPEKPGFARVISAELESGSLCKPSDDHVVLKVHYQIHMITPGLGALLALASGGGDSADPKFTPTATAVARCEVVRGLG